MKNLEETSFQPLLKTSNVDTRGRVYLPKKLREKFGLVEGEEVQFLIADAGVLLKSEEDDI